MLQQTCPHAAVVVLARMRDGRQPVAGHALAHHFTFAFRSRSIEEVLEEECGRGAAGCAGQEAWGSHSGEDGHCMRVQVGIYRNYHSCEGMSATSREIGSLVFGACVVCSC